MLRHTPFHARTAALNGSLSWKEWAGYAATCSFDLHSEREYFAVRHTAGLLDVSPLYKLEVTGPDAGRMLARVFTRDISTIGVGRVVYGCLCDEQGQTLDDGTVARLAPEHYRVTSSEPWGRWFRMHARGYDCSIHDSTDELAALALQGPRARAVLKNIVEFDMDRMRFFRVRKTTLAGLPVWISRTGYTGDLGYEIWTENAHALGVWDALIDAGKPHGLQPIGLDALDVARIEAGFVLQGIDYVCARRCVTDDRKSTPEEIGLGWTVDLDREPFLGQAALLKEKADGPEWDLVGLQLDWAQLEALYARYSLPPHLAPVACRSTVPVYNAGNQIGQVTSSTWSPLVKAYLCLATVKRAYNTPGTRLQVEHTVEFGERQRVDATVVERPFFDPERKRFTPAAAKKKKEATP